MTPPAWVRDGVALAVPAAAAVATSPLRSALPGAAVAAVIVGIVATVGPSASRWAVTVGAAIAATAFDVLWTRPYGSLRIHGRADAVTSAAVLVVGLLLAERSRRDRGRFAAADRPPARRLRRPAAPPDAALQLLTISRVAEDIAEGDATGLVLIDIARGMVDLLKLRDCSFEVAPLEPSDRPILRRSGDVEHRGTRWSPTLVGFSATGFEIPVRVAGQVQGRFVCLTRSHQRISADRLRAALTLADEAALALRLSPDADSG